MNASSIHLKVLLPYQVFADEPSVQSLVAQTVAGAFGILPHRRDCVVALRAGVLSYRTDGAEEHYLALDEGVLVKTGFDVTASVRNAIGGTELGKLREAVDLQFLGVTEQERALRQIASRLETSLVRRSVEFQRE